MDPSFTLIVVDDSHAAPAIAGLLGRLAEESAPAVVLTAEPLLGMRLRRAGLLVVLTIDGLDPEIVKECDGRALRGVEIAYRLGEVDWSAIDEVSYGPFFSYTLIPRFIRTVRNLHAITRVLQHHTVRRVVIVGGGELAAAARLLSRERGVRYRRVRSMPWHRLAAGLRRLGAGRHVRWVNSDFRALVLEPGLLLWLAVRHLISRAPSVRPPALLITGDRFTRGIVNQIGRDLGTVILAGATWPGRKLFRGSDRLLPIESFGRTADLVTGLKVSGVAVARALGLAWSRRPRPELVAEGVGYWPLVRRVVVAHLLAWPVVLRHLGRLIERVTAATTPGPLLVSSDVTAYNRMLVETAGAIGWQSIGLQHGILGEPNGHSRAHVDTMAIWGAASERWYRRQQPQRARFVITGNPGFDALAARLGARAGTPPRAGARAPFTVVVCTGFVSEYSVCASQYENLLMLAALVEWAGERTGVRVVHKLHPGEEPAYYEQVALQLHWPPGRLTAVRDVSLYDLLEQADALVASYSTTVLEAVALGTPAVVVDAIASRHHVPVDESPDATIAFSVADLHATLDRLRHQRHEHAGDDPRRRAFLHDWLSGPDGHATDRVAHLVRSVGTATPEVVGTGS